MPSIYQTFEINIDNNDGTTADASGQVVIVYDATNGVQLDDLTADAQGIIVTGPLPVDVGTLI